MSKKKKSRRPRTARRSSERAVRKLIADREKLALLEPGGSVERPLIVPSASVVESHAQQLGCLHCEEIPKVEHHDASSVDGRALRHVGLRCPRCGSRREVWLQIVRPTEQLN